MRELLVAALACAGCGKELNPKFCAAHSDDPRCAGTVDMPDAPDESTFPVAHLAPAFEAMLTSTADIVVDAPGSTIDTDTGTITPDWPGAVILPDVAQEDGPNVMVVQVHSLVVDALAESIDLDGDRPLIIVATTTIDVAARLNGSADGFNPGSGGHRGGEGPGAGQAGTANVTANGGGGGGSYQTMGGDGGDPGAGKQGATYGSAGRLEGGSGGGVPSKPGTCTVVPGAGGGGIQLTALVSINIHDEGRIHVGGSGGQGGVGCGSHGSGGAGGGAGGMVYLESPMLLGAGKLSAFGGGGGEGADSLGSTPGDNGKEAGIDGGGAGGGLGGGGNGGTGASDGVGSDAEDVGSDNNSGGGGGGAGWIFYQTSGPEPMYVAHPPPNKA